MYSGHRWDKKMWGFFTVTVVVDFERDVLALVVLQRYLDITRTGLRAIHGELRGSGGANAVLHTGPVNANFAGIGRLLDVNLEWKHECQRIIREKKSQHMKCHLECTRKGLLGAETPA